MSWMWYWHVHHDMLVEQSGNIEVRKLYIRKNKPKNEVALRLRLLKVVKNQSEVSRIMREIDRVRDSYLSLELAYDLYESQTASLYEQLDSLHRKECIGCPWNGKTIFPEEEF